MTKYQFGALLGLVLILASCKTGEKSARKSERLPARDARVRFNEVVANAVDYRTLTLKTNLSVDLGGKTFSTNATLWLEAGKSLSLTIQPVLGIELFRVEITADSIFVLDRMKKRYLAESMTDCRQKIPFPVTLDEIQALLLNRLFLPGRKPVTDDDYRRFVAEEAGAERMTLEPRRREKLHPLFTVDGGNRIEACRIELPNGSYVLWQYGAFAPEQGVSFPKREEIECRDASGAKRARATITFGKAEWNKPRKTPIAIPASYERISLQTMMNSIRL